MSTPLRFPVPDRFRRGAYAGRKTVDKGLEVLGYVKGATGVEDFGGLDILDFGCGYRIAQTLLEFDVPFGSYTGIDLDPEMIEWLQENTPDDRISFELVAFRNEMYRPDGEPMSADSQLPVGDTTFDQIWAFSVFTHLYPHDTRTLLTILRRHLKPGGVLFFTCAINPLMEADFVEGLPDEPLRMAIYQEAAMFDILDSTGWAAAHYSEPYGDVIQHHLVCHPTEDPHLLRPQRIVTGQSHWIRPAGASE